MLNVELRINLQQPTFGTGRSSIKTATECTAPYCLKAKHTLAQGRVRPAIWLAHLARGPGTQLKETPARRSVTPHRLMFFASIIVSTRVYDSPIAEASSLRYSVQSVRRLIGCALCHLKRVNVRVNTKNCLPLVVLCGQHMCQLP